MDLRVVAACASVAATLGCRGRDAPPPPPLAIPPGPVAADAVLDAVRVRAVPPLAVASASLAYVHADGTVAPTYGEIRVELGQTAVGVPADDPHRPLGAPVADAAPPPPPRCVQLHWKAGATSEDEVPCQGGAALPACSVAQLWRLAIADGAPANALASFELAHGRWRVVIDDAPRGFHFARTYTADACTASAATAPLPAEAA